jgi:hypothetical protein
MPDPDDLGPVERAHVASAKAVVKSNFAVYDAVLTLRDEVEALPVRIEND